MCGAVRALACHPDPMHLLKLSSTLCALTLACGPGGLAETTESESGTSTTTGGPETSSGPTTTTPPTTVTGDPGTDPTVSTITDPLPTTTTAPTTSPTSTTTSDDTTTTTTGDVTSNDDGDDPSSTGIEQVLTPLALELEDFDGDGESDLLVLGVDNFEGVAGRLSLGNGDGTFQPPIDPGLSGASAFPVVGELDDTPGVDVMMAQPGGKAEVFRFADGGFESWQQFTTPNLPMTHVVVDADEDDDKDIVWLWWTNNTLEFGLSIRPNGGGFFFEPVDSKIGVIAQVGIAPGSLLVGDLDGNSSADALVFEANKQKGFLRLFGSPGGLFGGPKFVAPTVRPWVAALGDFDEDGATDILAIERDPGRLVLVRGTGFGGFDVLTTVDVAAPFQPFTLAVADLDADTHLDVAVVDDQSPELRVWHGNGDGSFAPAESTPLPSGAVRVRAALLDGDAALDLVAATFAAGDVTVLLSP